MVELFNPEAPGYSRISGSSKNETRPPPQMINGQPLIIEYTRRDFLDCAEAHNMSSALIVQLANNTK